MLVLIVTIMQMARVMHCRTIVVTRTVVRIVKDARVAAGCWNSTSQPVAVPRDIPAQCDRALFAAREGDGGLRNRPRLKRFSGVCLYDARWGRHAPFSHRTAAFTPREDPPLHKSNDQPKCRRAFRLPTSTLIPRHGGSLPANLCLENFNVEAAENVPAR